MDALDELRVRDVFILCRCFPQIAQTETESKNDMILAFVCPHSVKQEDSRQVTQRVPVKLSITVCSTIWFCLPRERIKWNWMGQFVVVFCCCCCILFFWNALTKISIPTEMFVMPGVYAVLFFYIRITSVGSSEIAFEIRLNSVISLIQIVWWRDWDSQLAFWLQQNLTGIKSNETRILYDKTDNRQYVS